MNYFSSKRRLAFFAAFIVIPVALWAAEIRPTLKDRASYLKRQADAGAVQAANSKLPAQRDELRSSWEAFLPRVAGSFGELSDDLNPHLIQKRIFEVAQDLGCTVKIARLASRDDANFLRFSLIGEGVYGALVRFVDALEQGQHYVRFERVDLKLPGLEAMEGERNVSITGVLLIPVIASLGEQRSAQ